MCLYLIIFTMKKKQKLKLVLDLSLSQKKETITEEEINKIMKVIYQHVNSMSGVCIPGLDL